MSEPEPTDLPLRGRTVGITADRKADELREAFHRRGASTVLAPTGRIVPVEDDRRLVDETSAVVAARPDVVVVTTAPGLHAWLDVAGDELRTTLERSAIWVRSPKARAAVRAAGLVDVGIGGGETTESVVDALLADGVAGRTVAVQLPGYVDPRQLHRLADAGARVLTVTPYRWGPPPDPGAVDDLVDLTCAGEVDALPFTSAPAAAAFLHLAETTDRLPALLQALRADTLVAAVGPVTGEPLVAAGIDPWQPDRHRLGALVRLVTTELAAGQPER